jgi:hypothetical protein
MDEKDERITRLLQQMAPAPRDPLFRVKVLERRERQNYRNRVLGIVVSVTVVLVASAVTGGLPRQIVLGAGLAAAVVVYGAAMRQMLRRLF